jgi:hypothetical protein
VAIAGLLGRNCWIAGSVGYADAVLVGAGENLICFLAAAMWVMVITRPNHELAAMIQWRESCNKAEPQSNSSTGTSPTRSSPMNMMIFESP